MKVRSVSAYAINLEFYDEVETEGMKMVDNHDVMAGRRDCPYRKVPDAV